MSWADLLSEEENITVPWTGGRAIRSGSRTFRVKGRLPPEHGWHDFTVAGSREARWSGKSESEPTEVAEGLPSIIGYLVGGRLLTDALSASTEPREVGFNTEVVELVEVGLSRFSRVRTVRWHDGRLVYLGLEFPTGPEFDVTRAYEDKKASLDGITGVSPALDLAFRYETWLRDEAAKERAERERLEREETARLEKAEQRERLFKQLGDGAGRREMAKVDFEAAARAALAVADAELLDWQESPTPGQAIVRFRFRERRFECVAEKATLRIVDAGICLVDHGTGERGDTRFTLESLPVVMAQAMRERKLVQWRHVGDDEEW